MQRILLTTALLTGLMVTTAHAETVDSAHQKSESSATNRALAGTLVPIAAIVGGFAMAFSEADDLANFGIGLGLAGTGTLILGPSLGHWYSGKHVTPGLVTRVVGGGLLTAGVVRAVDNVCIFEPCESQNTNTALMLGGLTLIAAGAIWDIATADNAAREWNATHLQISPTVVTAGNTRAMGMAIGGSF